MAKIKNFYLHTLIDSFYKYLYLIQKPNIESLEGHIGMELLCNKTT